MATFLSSVALVAALWQGGGPTGGDSLSQWRERLARDSGDGEAWLRLAQGYVQLAAGYHQRHATDDTAWARAVLDSAGAAFARAAVLRAGSAQGDSARALRVVAWGEKAFLAWELGGRDAATRTWEALPEDVRLPPVLQELGENLLRACPREGVLLTAGAIQTHAVWYMRHVRGMRPDLLVLPLAVWESDPAFRARVARELRMSRSPATRVAPPEDPWLETFAQRRPLCASMGFERPPERRPKVKWAARPLVWVAGPGRDDKVPPQDFVFAALKLALDANDPWARPALVVYRRATELTSALCRTMATYDIPPAAVGCR
jgi:hypothetical protein